jgi:hypothetical protein
LIAELQELAERTQRPVGELLKSMIEQYKSNEPQEEPEGDPLLRLWEKAKNVKLEFSEHNVSERSREILETEYADYLLSRMRRDDAES